MRPLAAAVVMAIFAAGCSSSSNGEAGGAGSISSPAPFVASTPDSSRLAGLPTQAPLSSDGVVATPVCASPPQPKPPTNDTLFATGSSVLRPAASSSLAKISRSVRAAYIDPRMLITGFTDSRDTVEHNNQLSLARAQALVDWFVAFGWSRSRLTAVGKGESQLLVKDTDAAGNFIDAAGARNRRVTIKVTGRLSAGRPHPCAL